MTRSEAATILRGLIPQGSNLKNLPTEGKREITAAIDTLLNLFKDTANATPKPK